MPHSMHSAHLDASRTALWRDSCHAAWTWPRRRGLLTLRLFAATLLPNLPFAVARGLLHQHSGVINLDFFVLTLAAAAGFSTLASILFVCVTALEVLRLIDAVYFFSQRDVTRLPSRNGAFFAVRSKPRLDLVCGDPPSERPEQPSPVDLAQSPRRRCPVLADGEVCAQLAYVGAVLQSVRKLVLDPRIGRTAIVVVGDHAPPYASVERRDLFDDGDVPYLTLLPR